MGPNSLKKKKTPEQLKKDKEFQRKIDEMRLNNYGIWDADYPDYGGI